MTSPAAGLPVPEESGLNLLARHYSTCPLCCEKVEPGEPIGHDEDSGTWAHSACLEEPPPAPRSPPRCRFCADVLDEDGRCPSCS